MERPDRHSIRLEGFDYSAPRAYFVTTCVARRRRLLANVVEDALVLTRMGEIVAEVWQRMPTSVGVAIDSFVVMPDHFHGIVHLNHHVNGLPSQALTQVVGAFKSISSRRIRREARGPSPFWQRSFHDRIVRTDRELEAIRRYIENNPATWIASL